MIIGVICSDERMIQVADNLSTNNVVYKIFSEEDINDLKQVNVVILPIHGMNSKYQIKMWKSYITLPNDCFNESVIVFQGIHEKDNPKIASKTIYYLENSKVKEQNAILTAEGVVKEFIQHTSSSIYDVSVDIVGYGVCGSAIATILHNLGVDIRIIRRSCMETGLFCPLSKWTGCKDVIINTAPDRIINIERLKSWNKVPLILDISNYTLFDDKELEMIPMHYYKLPNLPGRYAPISAGNIIAEYVRGILCGQ